MHLMQASNHTITIYLRNGEYSQNFSFAVPYMLIKWENNYETRQAFVVTAGE